MSKLVEYNQIISAAELMFKLSVGLTAEAHVGKLPIVWDFGKHSISRAELSLSPDEHRIASVALEHCTTYIIALELDAVLAQTIPDRFNHKDDVMRSASWIARLIRNAFAHDPLQPKWKTYPECDAKKYSVSGVIELETTGLNGKPVDRMDYGGPIALLRLSEYLRQSILVEKPAVS